MRTLIAALMLAAAHAAPALAAPTPIASTAAPAAYDIVPASFTFVACDPSNGNSFIHTGREVLVVFNSDIAAHAMTVTSVADASGRTGDSTKNVGAGAYYVFQFFPPLGWRQTDGTIRMTCADATLKYAVLRFP